MPGKNPVGVSKSRVIRGLILLAILLLIVANAFTLLVSFAGLSLESPSNSSWGQGADRPKRTKTQEPINFDEIELFKKNDNGNTPKGAEGPISLLPRTKTIVPEFKMPCRGYNV